jgi:hypothetical protein
MLADNKNFREAAHVGDEIMNDQVLALRSKCLSVYETVTDKTFTLEKALKLYNVPYETYIEFAALKQAEEMEDQARSDSKAGEITFKIDVMEKLFEYSFPAMKKEQFDKVLNVLIEYSKEVNDNKVFVK